MICVSIHSPSGINRTDWRIVMFEYSWVGGRTPKIITFPDGAVREVNYTRDGIIIFKSGPGATYERIDDYSARIAPIESTAEASVAALEFQLKQGGGK